MKALLPVLFITLFLTSCEKSKCWKCAWDDRPTDEMTVCDRTETEIVRYEKDMSFQAEDGHWIKMSCHSY